MKSTLGQVEISTDPRCSIMLHIREASMLRLCRVLPVGLLAMSAACGPRAPASPQNPVPHAAAAPARTAAAADTVRACTGKSAPGAPFEAAVHFVWERPRHVAVELGRPAYVALFSVGVPTIASGDEVFLVYPRNRHAALQQLHAGLHELPVGPRGYLILFASEEPLDLAGFQGSRLPPGLRSQLRILTPRAAAPVIARAIVPDIETTAWTMACEVVP